MIGLVLLAGCNSLAVPPAQERRVVQRVQRDLAPYAPASIATWYASGIEGDVICGEIEATPSLRDQQPTLRYVYYDGAKSPTVSIEPHLVAIGDEDRKSVV